MTRQGKDAFVPQIDVLNGNDKDRLRSLAASVGWDFSDDRMLTFLRAGKFYGHRIHSAPVSSAGLFSYGSALSGIGIVMVHPTYQRIGLGKSLVELCLETLDSKAALLTATKMGAPLYAQLGFVAVDNIERWVLSNDAEDLALIRMAGECTKESECRFEMISETNIPSVITFDRHLTGLHRQSVLSALALMDKKDDTIELMTGVSGVVAVNERTKEIEGFALTSETKHQIQVGPVVSTTIDVAIAVLEQAVAKSKGSGKLSHKPLRIDVPAHQEAFIEVLRKSRWNLQQTSPLMAFGSWENDLYNNHVYGLIDPAFG